MAQTEELTYAYFFFTDIVGLSDPRIPTKRQIKKIETLTNLITSCEAFKNTEPGLMLYLPTGDGMAIGFLSGPELPLMLAVELHKKLKEYNRGRFPEEILRIRIGINDGPVYIVKGMSGSNNLWGPGILLARSVMDLGDDDHILLSPQTAEALWEMSDEYKQLIKPVHDYEMKDGKSILIYSAYGDDVGNPDKPKKSIYQKRMMKNYVKKTKTTTLYSNIDVTLTITEPKKMLTRYKESYNIKNIADEPIQSVMHAITTHVRMSFDDLNIKVTDQAGTQLKVSSINFDSNFQKEFTTKLDKPILKGEKASYTVEYDAEEPKRYFENYFNFDCGKYSVSLRYPSDVKIKPVVYDVSTKKTRTKTQPTLKKLKDGLVQASWSTSNVMEDRAFRMEW